MKKKCLVVMSTSLIAATTMAIYLFGPQQERTGEGLAVVKEAISTETKAPGQ